ncbi:TfuA-like protein [Streptomyces exfoliatus]|uniref:TfuA-like protein n=1 Tax=Streptomyces exfoliatus TaxID=1905 RepID=UPI003C306C0C
MTIVVFLGPSLPLEDARSILPDAVYLPPARQADLISALDHAPDAIGLIDGEFHQSRSVWHKEILIALERGVRVFGSSSMGALRAAELEPYGMTGVGGVFERFASGELIDDDEVALLYHMEDGDYRHVSEPMVNIRATLESAAASGRVPESLLAEALRAAKSLHYTERTRRAVAECLRAGGTDAEAVAALDDVWAAEPVDIKAQDARQLLHLLRLYAEQGAPRGGTVPKVARTAALDSLYDRERRVSIGGLSVSMEEIAEYIQLHHPRAAAVNAAAMNRTLVLVLADLLHVEPAKAEVESEEHRWRVRHGKTEDGAFSAWLAQNHLTREEFRQLARENAICRHLWRWLLYVRHVERTARPLLDHLRWEDAYVPWASDAADHTALPTPRDEGLLQALTPEEAERLHAQHRSRHGLPAETDLVSWAEEAGFNSPELLLLALVKASHRHAATTTHSPSRHEEEQP